MKALFIAAGTSPASVFALASLATSVRNAGHEILMAAFDELTPSIEAVGLPPVSVVATETTDSIKTLDRPGGVLEFPPPPEKELLYCGSWFARQAAVSLDGLLELSEAWRPDLVIGGTLAYATSLVAARLGIPDVRQMWDWVDFRGAHPYARKELQPELSRLGLDGLPEPDLYLDICPPSLRPPDAVPARMMRWIPGNRQRKLEPWMYTRGDRPRVCLTLGSFRAAQGDMFEYLCDLVAGLRPLDAELVVATTEDIAARLRERFPGIRSGWVPLEFLAPTCDLIVHNSGGLTGMTAMNTGTPQLILNQFELYDDSLRRLDAHGSGIVLYRGQDTTAAVFEACRSLLSDKTYRERARALSRELAVLPTPPELVGSLEQLVAG